MLDAETLKREYVNEAEAAGAMLEPDGIGIHAAKLAFGYINMARKLGAKIHPSSPVMGWKTVDGVHHLTTPGGHREGARRRRCHRRLFNAGPASEAEAEDHADLVKFYRHAAADR